MPPLFYSTSKTSHVSYVTPSSNPSINPRAPPRPSPPFWSIPAPPRERPLELAQGQVAQHLAGGDEGHAPEGGEVEGGGEAVGEAEEEHGGDPAAGVLEGEAALGHLVLLDDAADEVVDGARLVDLGLVGAGGVGELGAREDVEVVVGRVAPRVALGADGGAEDD